MIIFVSVTVHDTDTFFTPNFLQSLKFLTKLQILFCFIQSFCVVVSKSVSLRSEEVNGQRKGYITLKSLRRLSINGFCVSTLVFQVENMFLQMMNCCDFALSPLVIRRFLIIENVQKNNRIASLVVADAEFTTGFF